MKRFTLLCVCVSALVLPAQSGQPNELAQKRLEKLQKALGRVVATRSVTFQTRYDTKDAAREEMYKRLGREGPKTVPQVMNGNLVGDVLFHAVSKKEQVATRGRLRIARSGGAWEATLGRFPDEKPSPFLFDPERFCRMLLLGKLAIAKHTVGVFENKPVEIYTLHYSGKDAVRLGRAGVFPDGVRNSSPTISFARAGGGAVFALRAAGPLRGGLKIDQDVDIALFLEPGKGDLLHAKLRYYKTSPMAGRAKAVMLRGAGGRVEEEEDVDEEEADDKPKKLVFQNGLPVRRTKDKIVTQFDITFASHGTAKGPELNARARHLLDLDK